MEPVTRPTLADVWDELQRGRVYECSLSDKRWHLDGLKDGQDVFIDVRPSILETLLHELLHRLKPRWGERRVTLEARHLLSHMSESQMRSWWTAYRRIRKRRGPVQITDDD